jgi:hypothetical protein
MTHLMSTTMTHLMSATVTTMICGESSGSG